MICQPAFDYGATRLDWQRRGDDGTDAEVSHNDIHLILTGDLPIGVDGTDARARHRMKAGEVRYSAISWGPAPIPPSSAEECEQRLQRTVDYWRRWLEGGSFPDHPWRDFLQRSALVLKGLTYSPTGALIAALTTSLPETPGGERNWDYRFTWIRDATFTLWALHTLSLDYEATDFMGWLADVYKDERRGRPTRAADHVRDRRQAGPDRDDPRQSERLRGRQAGSHRERRVQPASERRLRSAARLRLHPRQGAGPPAPRALGGALPPGRVGDRRLGEARPGDLGGARGTQALRLLEADVLGRTGPRLPPRRPDRRRGPAAHAGARSRSRSARTSSRRASRNAASSASTTRPTRSTPPRCWSRWSASCRRTTSGWSTRSRRSTRS